MSLLGAADVRRLAQQAGARPTKVLGQNFVVDANTIRRIVRLAQLGADDVVLEVGPGLGSLTLGLLEHGHRVVAVEIDPVLARQLPATAEAFSPGTADRLTVIEADAARIGPVDPSPQALVANLPYNVAVPVLLHCLVTMPGLRRCLVMVQAEVADRLAAPPGSRIYGAPSVKAAWFGSAAKVATVPASVFWPVPRVESGLVALDVTGPPDADVSRERVFALVDLLFGQRRKMVRATLAGRYGRDEAMRILAAAGADPQARPEQWGLQQFIAVARELPADAVGAHDPATAG